VARNLEMVGMGYFSQRASILAVDVMVLLCKFKMNLIAIPRQLEFPSVCFVEYDPRKLLH
jgi:hypothetical protein